jgi:hypothetical protein
MKEESMDKGIRKKQSFTGLGLVFGTALGAGLSLIITGNVLWSGIGTALGLIIGAAIDSHVNNKNKDQNMDQTEFPKGSS